MNRFLVLDGDRELYVAVLRDDRLHVYDPHTERFHDSSPLWRDFFIERELTYRPLDDLQARELIAAGAGRYDGRALSDLLASRKADSAARTVDDLLGAPEAGQVEVISDRQRATSLAEQMAAQPGDWLTWKTYPRADPAAAAASRVQASALRTGKLAAVRDLPGRVEAQTVPVGERIEVRARLV